MGEALNKLNEVEELERFQKGWGNPGTPAKAKPADSQHVQRRTAEDKDERIRGADRENR